MILDKFKIKNSAFLKPKTQFPGATDRDGPLPLPVSMQGLRTVGGQGLQVLAGHRRFNMSSFRSKRAAKGGTRLCLPLCQNSSNHDWSEKVLIMLL